MIGEIKEIPLLERSPKEQEADRKENAELQNEAGGVAAYINSLFRDAQMKRLVTEQNWLDNYRNYRGEYNPDQLSKIKPNKSNVFVKITKTKVLAAYGQLIEVLFSDNKFPIGVEPTVVPEGISEYAYLDPSKAQVNEEPEQKIVDRYGYTGDGNTLPPGAVAHTLMLGDLQSKYGSLGFQAGPSPDKTKIPQIEPAKEAAINMEKTIHDQLDSANASNGLRTCLFEMCLLGTGILKGPYTKSKTVHNWTRGEDGKINYEPYERLAPAITSVSAWNFYPDPAARTLFDAEWTIERHIYNRIQMRGLLDKPFFNKEAISYCLQYNTNYTPQWFEQHLRDNKNINEQGNNRFEVFEYWGVIDKRMAEQAGLNIDPDDPGANAKLDPISQVPVNIWVCNGQVLRIVKNPYTPSRLPYEVCPYEINPYQIWGIGVAENMEDSQLIINGLSRMTIDNLNLSGNVIFDVSEDALVPGETMETYPGKIFRRQSGQPGQAVYAITIPNTSQASMQVFDRFRQFADEETGIPSYAHGQTGITTTTRTASGMSMLMGASALNIKTVIKNIDDYMLRPLGEAMFSWNMQFNDDQQLPVRGDLEIKARGTQALMQKEVRSQRLMTFMQVAQNPQLAPFVKWQTLLKEVAETLDIEPEKIINDPEQAAIYARIVGLQQGPGAASESALTNSGEPGEMAPPQGMASGANAADATGRGGGNIGTGTPATPGESSFSASTPTTTGKG